MGGRRDERFDTDLRIKLGQGDGVMRNVSVSGIYFLTAMALKPGQPLTFTIEFPGFARVVAARCEARVVRVESKGALNGVGAALERIQLQGSSP
jgi:PilZ domain